MDHQKIIVLVAINANLDFYSIISAFVNKDTLIITEHVWIVI